jgi:hypothetical protein
MFKKLALIFGVVFTVVGLLGWVPGVTNNDMLLGIFHVDTIHNLVHLVTGLVGIWLGSSSESGSKSWFQIFGVIYALVTILGFMAGDGKILGFLTNNMADTWLHLVLTVALLAIGFGMKSDAAPAEKM